MVRTCAARGYTAFVEKLYRPICRKVLTGFFDYFAWNKENGKNWDHWVGTL